MASEFVLIARNGSVTTATLNRPDKRNALNVELLDQLCAAVALAESDPTQRILVLRGAGTVFCSGLDLVEATDAARAHASAEGIGRALRALNASRLVTIAAVHGAAIAGGAGIMSACDIAIATHNTKFAYPEVRRGLVPALVMTFLRRQLRERDARELLLLGKVFDATHAHAIGLINRIVGDEAALETEIQTLVSSVLQGAPDAVTATKKLLADLWPLSVDDDLKRARAFHLSARDSAEAREGIAAFKEKRPPSWAPKRDLI
jgi:methylglutaconyl-CoA hydratase